MMNSSIPGDGIVNVSDRKDKSSCRPPKGKTYLTIGQDFFSIQEYVSSQYNANLHRHDVDRIHGYVGNSFRTASGIPPLTYFHPACTMAYTDIYQLKGLDQPADYGSGIEYIKGLTEAFPESGLQIGLWLNGYQGCRDIVSGALNEKIRRLFDFIQSELPKSLPKVFLRVGYEFDNPSFGYSDDPKAYQEAFRALVRACETQMTSNLCHEKVIFVWHSWAAPRRFDVTLDQFYPGDYYVDWVGISIFQQLYPWANDRNQNEQGENFVGGNLMEVTEVLEFAESHGKPIMIAESTPFGGMNVIKSSVARKYIEEDGNNNDIWNLWYQKTIDLIDTYDISMWSYINCDWSSFLMWKDTGFGDTRLSSSDVVMSHWREQVLAKNTRFLLRIESCDDQSTPGSSKDKDADIPVAHQPVRPKSTALTMLSGFDTVGQEMTAFTEINAFTSSNLLTYSIYSGSLVLMVFLCIKILHKIQKRNGVKPATSSIFYFPNGKSGGVYGSCE